MDQDPEGQRDTSPEARAIKQVVTVGMVRRVGMEAATTATAIVVDGGRITDTGIDALSSHH